MRIKFKESFGTVDVPQVDESTKTKLLQEGKKYILKPQIEAIHAGLTRNKTFYQADKLQGDPSMDSGVYSWYKPYAKPMIKNHDTETEPLGRISEAYYVNSSSNGKPAVIVVPTITDKDAIEKVLDGRYSTVSIGAETDSVTCSICGVNLLEEEFGGWGHEHIRGQKYDGEECYWIIGNVWFDELSFVNVPADQGAGVINIGTPVEVKGSDDTQESDTELVLDLNLGRFVDKNGQIVDKEAISVVFKQTSGPESGSENKEDNTMPKENETPTAPVDNNPVEPVAEGAPVEPEQKVEENVPGGETPTQTAEGATGSVIEMTIEEAKNEIGRLNALVASLETEKAELQEKANLVEGLQTQVTELQGTVEGLETEKTTLIENNARLESEAHKSLAETVVDLKISLRKLKPEEKDQAVIDHTARSAESLRDSLNDLKVESQKGVFIMAQAIEKIASPGLTIEHDGTSPSEPVKAKARTMAEKIDSDYGVVRDLLTPKKISR